MKQSRREFLLGLGAMAGYCLFGRTRYGLAAANRSFRMLVVGDSLISGQGLNEADKFFTLTGNWLAEDFFSGKRAIDIKNLSHSGARLFLSKEEIRALETARKDPEMFYHREVNFSFPSTKTQIDIAARQYVSDGMAASDVDLVLLSGGLTDINASYVLNAFKKYRPLRRKIEEHCNEGMFRFLKHATGVFPSALFVVVGYFPMVSKESSTGEIYNTVLEFYKFPRPTKPVLNNIATKQLFKILHGRLSKRSRIWFEESTKALETAVNRVNEHNGRLSSVFVESPITEDRAFETSDSLLWGMGKKGRSEDDMYDVRKVECAEAINRVSDVKLTYRKRVCELSGIGHPNPAGSRLYAEAIQNKLKQILKRDQK